MSKQFTTQLEYDKGVVFVVTGELDPGEPMTWTGFYWEPGCAAAVDIESVCVVGTRANLIDALSESALGWIRGMVKEQMETTT